jgi:CheY-like chemotaxis protein
VRPLRVGTLFDEAASLLKASLPAGIELVIDSVPPDLAVAGETAQLQQVILNLCTNAAQAMPDGGQIRLAAEQTEVLDFLPMSHGVLAPGRYVCLSVVDSGCGFDEKVARRLFEPFFTTRATGTGLGLATVREIIRDHDGAINVHSQPGHGSRFEAWLPAAADDRTEAVSAPLPLGRGETVLIVESERAQLLGDEEMLAALGYEPVGFERAADAIAACRATPDRFDLLLVTQAAQSRGEIGLARTLHELAPRHPILLATESTLEVSIDALAAAGVSEVLRRPLVGSELAEAMARALRSIRAANP